MRRGNRTKTWIVAALLLSLCGAPALAEALQSVARCLWRLDGRLLDDKTRARAAAAVDVAINDLRRWREKAG